MCNKSYLFFATKIFKEELKNGKENEVQPD